MSLKLSCSSIAASAEDDDVSLSLDYGKLYRRIEESVRQWPNAHKEPAKILPIVGLYEQPVHEPPSIDPGQDLSVLGGRIASLALGYLQETALQISKERPGAIQPDFGQIEVSLHLPKALLRAEKGLLFRSLHTLGYSPEGVAVAVVEGEEFWIQNICCHCIIGINPHERLEKQTVVVSLGFKGPGHHQWRARFLETYQEMTRIVAEVGITLV
jgi:dihydroneopterin aldolase